MFTFSKYIFDIFYMFVFVCLSLFQQAIEAGEPRTFFQNCLQYIMFTACTHSARITRLHVLQKSYMGEDTPPAYLCPNQTLCKHVHVRNSGSWFCRSTSQIRAFWGGIPFLKHPKPPFGVRSCDVLSYHLHLLFCRCCGNHTTGSPTTAVAADLDCIHHDFHYR